jgi:hypothetical protein
MNIGDKVTYASDVRYVGIILEVRETLCRVIWLRDENVEWMPIYSLILKN